MQKTRETILKYLKEKGEATVDELSSVLGGLTSVTVRHHLDILRGAGFVSDPMIRHRATPGRPQYAYTLTGKASEHFPKNYRDLAGHLLEEMKACPPHGGVNIFFEGVANRMSALAQPVVAGETLDQQLDHAVAFLNSQGYVANWERADDGYLLHTCNCPYEALAKDNPELCGMDLTLVSNLLGLVPRRISRVVEGATSCAYFIPLATEQVIK